MFLVLCQMFQRVSSSCDTFVNGSFKTIDWSIPLRWIETGLKDSYLSSLFGDATSVVTQKVTFSDVVNMRVEITTLQANLIVDCLYAKFLHRRCRWVCLLDSASSEKEQILDSRNNLFFTVGVPLKCLSSAKRKLRRPPLASCRVQHIKEYIGTLECPVFVRGSAVNSIPNLIGIKDAENRFRLNL